VGDRGGVVAEVLEGGVTGEERVSHDVELREHGGLFEVDVGDLASWVCGGDDGVLDVGIQGCRGTGSSSPHAGCPYSGPGDDVSKATSLLPHLAVTSSVDL
jgi:hypothetical protein